jgi:hypothetical protein
MPWQRCAICHKDDYTSNMKYCSQCDLWVHYSCAGGGVFSDAYCPQCSKKLG